MRLVLTAIVGIAAALLLGVQPAWASLYQPDDPRLSIPGGPDGRGQALPADEFDRRFLTLMNQLNPQLTSPDSKSQTDREKLMGRIAERKKLRNPTVEDTAALAADLLRAGKLDEALNQLAPRVRDRRPNYFVLTTLAQAHALRNEWSEAVEYQTSAVYDVEMPPQVKGLSPAQREWQAMLDRDYVLRYYQIRKAEAAARPRPAPEDEDVYPLFPLPERGKPFHPLRFVDAQGNYTPGDLSPAERAKLPPDAIAIVQQLLLWFPTDTRLYWLLAELYTAHGQFADAAEILDRCTWSRQYGNRKVLMSHRTAIRQALDERRKAAAENKAAEEEKRLAADTEEQARKERDLRKVQQTAETGWYALWVMVGLIGLVLVLGIVRALSRRKAGPGCGPLR